MALMTDDEQKRDSTTPTPDATAPVEKEANPLPDAPSAAGPKVFSAADVFGAPVKDSQSAQKRGPRAAEVTVDGETVPKKRGRKPTEPVEVTDEHEVTARGFLVMADGALRGLAATRYGGELAPESLKALDEQLKLQEGHYDAMTPPLARGLAEMKVKLPWWAQFGLAAGVAWGPRIGALVQLEMAVSKRKKEEGAAK